MPKELWNRMIDAFFAGRPDEFVGEADYWKTLPPDDPEWSDFFDAMVRVIS